MDTMVVFQRGKLESVSRGERRVCLRRAGQTLLGLVGLLLLPQGVTGQVAGAVWLVSADRAGVAGNGPSTASAVNPAGDLVVFSSEASNLVAGDRNGFRDVFLWDRSGGSVELISRSVSGGFGNGASPADAGPVGVSADGQVVVFSSNASNLVSGDSNGKADVFLHRRDGSGTILISAASGGGLADGGSSHPGISADGTRVAFQSEATNLVPGDTNGFSDIFVRDMEAGVTERPCALEGANGPSWGPVLSADGRVVAFTSSASNLVPGDANNRADIFVCDVESGLLERVSVGDCDCDADGDSAAASISADGRFVAFRSAATNLVNDDFNGAFDVFVRDRAEGRTERLSVSVTGGNADDFSGPPSISGDGRFVAFVSAASNLVFEDANRVADVFVRDRSISKTILAARGPSGELPNGAALDLPPSISADGRWTSFASLASNLAGQDRNEHADVYLALNPYFGEGSCPDQVCPNGQVCVDGFCRVPTRTPTVTRTPTPTVTRTRTPTPTPEPTFQPCDDDSECGPDQHCRGGACRRKRLCDASDPGAGKLFCFEREACVGSLCECGGDCNLDGFVFGNEITLGVNVLARKIPLSRCVAGDIDGNGAITGSEITLSVINLARGCAQEARPLLFSRDRGGQVTLHAESVAVGSGDEVEVKVAAVGGQGDIATVQLDLLFDSDVFSIDRPDESCSLAEPLRGSHVLVTSLGDREEGSTTRRLLLFVGDLTSPIASFDDGPVVSCRFLRHGTRGDSGFALDGMEVGDPRGDVFGVAGSLSAPAPLESGESEASAGPLCPGDCNRDGDVLGSEVTTVVRIMAGEIGVEACPAADSNGDGEVTVSDVSRAVSSLGRGCPR